MKIGSDFIDQNVIISIRARPESIRTYDDGSVYATVVTEFGTELDISVPKGTLIGEFATFTIEGKFHSKYTEQTAPNTSEEVYFIEVKGEYLDIPESDIENVTVSWQEACKILDVKEFTDMHPEWDLQDGKMTIYAGDATITWDTINQKMALVVGDSNIISVFNPQGFECEKRF